MSSADNSKKREEESSSVSVWEREATWFYTSNFSMAQVAALSNSGMVRAFLSTSEWPNKKTLDSKAVCKRLIHYKL